MDKSIRHFQEISIRVFQNIIEEFFKDPKDFASFTRGITDELHSLGRFLIKETLEDMDERLRHSEERKRNWTIETRSDKQLVTVLGTVNFKKTFFKNKITDETDCLLDQILGFDKNERIAEDAHAKILEEAVQTSYRRGGEAATFTETEVTKETVMKKIHALQFPKGWETPEEKKVVPYLYIEADEDHLSLQFRDKKGDLKKTKRGNKNNNAIAKLIYVHEGIEPEAPQSTRNRLINPHYFSRTAEGCSNEELWDEVYRYLDTNYDLTKVKKIFISSDGGGWIKSGMRRIGGLVHLLDQYHLEKHLTKLTAHMKDSANDARAELYRVICKGTKPEFYKLLWRLKGCLPKEASLERFDDSANFILNNWMAARLRLQKTQGKVGSSTEGHVSHVLSHRMSTAALGWSLLGADKMAQLRAYYLNGGDMLTLVRYQKTMLKKAAGEEDRYLSASDIISSTRNKNGVLGKYYDSMQHHLCGDWKVNKYFQEHVFRLKP